MFRVSWSLQPHQDTALTKRDLFGLPFTITENQTILYISYFSYEQFQSRHLNPSYSFQESAPIKVPLFGGLQHSQNSKLTNGIFTHLLLFQYSS